MSRPTEDQLRDQLTRHAQALRTELRQAFEDPPARIAAALRARLNEVEAQRPGRGPAEAAQELRAGQLRDAAGQPFRPRPGPGAQVALARAATQAERAYQSQLLLKYPQRASGLEGRGPARAEVQLGPGSSAAPGAHRAVLDNAAARIQGVAEAEGHAAQLQAAKKHALEADGVLKRIAGEDRAVQHTEKALHGELRRMYRNPAAAMQAFQRACGPLELWPKRDLGFDTKRREYAVRTLESNPSAFGRLRSAAASLWRGSRDAAARGPVAAGHAERWLAACASQQQAICYTDPLGRAYTARAEVRDAATQVLGRASHQIDRASAALKRLGGLHGSKHQAIRALGQLNARQHALLRTRLGEGLPGRGGGDGGPGALPQKQPLQLYSKLMAVREIGQTVARAIDPM